MVTSTNSIFIIKKKNPSQFKENVKCYFFGINQKKKITKTKNKAQLFPLPNHFVVKSQRIALTIQVLLGHLLVDNFKKIFILLL